MTYDYNCQKHGDMVLNSSCNDRHKQKCPVCDELLQLLVSKPPVSYQQLSYGTDRRRK